MALLDERRGQANVISLMILVAATLAVAIALYGYFSGMYAAQGSKQSLYTVYSQYANSVNVYLEAYSTSKLDGRYQYCILVSVVNKAGSPLTLYLSTLPLAPSPGGLTVGGSILYTPVDYRDYEPKRNEYAWLAEDYNGDGVVELLKGPGQAEFNTVASCEDLEAYYINNKLTGLSLPIDVDEIGLGYYASNVLTQPEGLSLFDLSKSLGVPSDAVVPFWNLTLEAFGKKSVYFFVSSPVDPGQLSVVAAFKSPVDGKLVIFTVQTVKK